MQKSKMRILMFRLEGECDGGGVRRGAGSFLLETAGLSCYTFKVGQRSVHDRIATPYAGNVDPEVGW